MSAKDWLPANSSKQTINKLELLMKVYEKGGEQAFDRAWREITRSHRDQDAPPKPASTK